MLHFHNFFRIKPSCCLHYFTFTLSEWSALSKYKLNNQQCVHRFDCELQLYTSIIQLELSKIRNSRLWLSCNAQCWPKDGDLPMIWIFLWEFCVLAGLGGRMKAYNHFASVFVTFSQSVWYPWTVFVKY